MGVEGPTMLLARPGGASLLHLQPEAGEFDRHVAGGRRPVLQKAGWTVPLLTIRPWPALIP